MRNLYYWIALLLLSCLLSRAQTPTPVGAVSGRCEQGATQATTSGLKSTNYQLGLIPNCTVTVFYTGGTSRAVIYSDTNKTPLNNPFTGTPQGRWQFFATVNQGYDVVLTGGIPPNIYTTPQTFVGLYPDQNLQSVATPPAGNVGEVQINTAGQFGAATGVTYDNNGGLNLTGGINVTGPIIGNGSQITNINPTGLAWPPTCSTTGYTYDFATNTCKLYIPGPSVNPATQVSWPPSCTTGTYIPSTNVCVPTGTAANPGPPAGSGQMNAGGTFSSIPGFTADPSLGFVTAGGVTYAKGAQTGVGANGIVNSIPANGSAYGKNVVSDNSYEVTTTASMTQGSNTITVANPAGIVPGMSISGNVTGLSTVGSVAGNVVTISAGNALSTNASANVNFFESPYKPLSQSYPPASNLNYEDKKLGFRNVIQRDPGTNPVLGNAGFNFQGCISTKRQTYSSSTSIGATNEVCQYMYSWFGAPSTNYGNPGVGPTNWGITRATTYLTTNTQKGIGEMTGGTFIKSGIGDGPISYFYYGDYLGSVAPSDEGQGGAFIAGGEATTTTTGTVSSGGGGTGTQNLSYTCISDCITQGNQFIGGPGQGRYMIDKTGAISFTALGWTSPYNTNVASGNPGVIYIDTAVGVSTFWGQIGSTLTGNMTSGSPTVSALSTTATFSVNDPISGTGIPAGTTIIAINAGASTLTMSANATSTGTGRTITTSNVVTPPSPPNANGVPFSSGTTDMTFSVNSGTLNVVYTVNDALNASGGTTTYTGPGLLNSCSTPGMTLTVAGFAASSGINNGTFTCVSSTANTLVLNNPSGIAEHRGATATFAAANSGSPQVGDLVCFSWPWHEQAKIKSVNSGTFPGPWSITVPLRMAHDALGWMFSNGGCGSFADMTANDIPVAAGFPAVVLHYPFDIIGTVTPYTMVYDWFSTGAQNAGNLVSVGNSANNSIGLAFFPVSPGGTAVNAGGLVTLSGITQTSQPFLFYQPAIQIATAYDSAYVGLCLNSFPNTFKQLVCSQTSSIGHASSAGVTIGLPNTGGAIYRGAETLDVLDYNEANCAAQVVGGHAPCYDSKNVTLEPNNAAWATGDAIEQPHHYSGQVKAGKEGFSYFNPYGLANGNAWNFSISGQGVQGGNEANLAANWAMARFASANPGSMYMGHGGIAYPPGGLVVGGGGIGPKYGLLLEHAPEPSGTELFYVGCPTSPFLCTDRSFNYNILNLAGNTANGVMSFYPFSGAMILGNGTGPVTWNSVNNDINFLQARDNIKFAPLATPVIVANLPTATSGGTKPDSTQYNYTVTAKSNAGSSLASAEVQKITGASGSNANTITVQWGRVNGAISYQVCMSQNGTGGGEILLATVNGPDATFYVDGTATTPTGSACLNAATQPGIDQAGQVGINSSGTVRENILQAAAGLTANVTTTLPALTGTVPVVVAGGTANMTTGTISSGTCGTVVTPTGAFVTQGSVANVQTTDSIKWSYASSPVGNQASTLIVNQWVGAGSVNFVYCNPVGGPSETPSAITINWQVTR